MRMLPVREFNVLIVRLTEIIVIETKSKSKPTEHLRTARPAFQKLLLRSPFSSKCSITSTKFTWTGALATETFFFLFEYYHNY